MKKNRLILFTLCLLFPFYSVAQTSDVTVKRNIVDINIRLKGHGELEVNKTERVLPGDPEKRIIVIKDSDTGNPVPEANVEIDKIWDVLTNRNGQADLPVEVEDGEHVMVVTKENVYVRTESRFVVREGEITTPPQISVPKAVDYERIKIVLDWGEYPEDLDSHIFSDDYHVYFENMNEGNLNLDRDDTTSFGPETVTIRDIENSELYQYYVYDYTNGGDRNCSEMSNSGAQVRVYHNNNLITSFNITPNQVGYWWHVFDIRNGKEIIKYDKVSNYRD